MADPSGLNERPTEEKEKGRGQEVDWEAISQVIRENRGTGEGRKEGVAEE